MAVASWREQNIFFYFHGIIKMLLEVSRGYFESVNVFRLPLLKVPGDAITLEYKLLIIVVEQ